MEDLKIEATDSTPEIYCEVSTRRIMFRGRSIPENATSFYSPVFDWIENYKQSDAPKTELEFYLDYINSISQKIILDILNEFSDLKEKGNDVKVKWVYEADDEEMEDEGRVFASKVNLDFELIPKTVG